MNSKLLIALAMLLIAPEAIKADNNPDVVALTEIKLKLWPSAYREADPALLEQLLAPEFQSIDGQGTVSTRAQEIAYVRNKPKDPETRRFKFEIERLEFFNEVSAIITGVGHIADPRHAKPLDMRYRSSNIFVRRNGKWLIVASHVSPPLSE